MPTDKIRLKNITEIIRIHCDIAFNDSFYKTTKSLMNKLKKNKEFSMDSGKIEGWIAALLYVVGEDSDLFNPKNWIKEKLYISKTDLAGGVGVSASTMRSRAQNIREALPEGSKFVANIKLDENYYDSKMNSSNENLDNISDYINSWSENIRKTEKYEIYMVKARRAKNYDEAIELIKMALLEAKEKINKGQDDSLEGKMWTDPKARPFMMIKEELAFVYTMGGEYEDAIDEYKSLLELDLDDNLGVRHKLLNLFIITEKQDSANRLIEYFNEDESTFMLYTKALYYFIQNDDINSKTYLNKALEANMYVPLFLLGMRQVEDNVPDEYAIGSYEEAMVYFEESVDAWISNSESLLWLIEEFFNFADKKNINIGCTKEEAKNAIEFALNKTDY